MGGGGREIQEGGDIYIPMTDSCWCMAETNKINSVQSVSRVQLCDPHGLQRARLPYPSPALGVCSDSCLLSRWCHLTISSSVVPFSFCLQSFPASGSFLIGQFFASGGQSIGASTWTSNELLFIGASNEQNIVKQLFSNEKKLVNALKVFALVLQSQAETVCSFYSGPCGLMSCLNPGPGPCEFGVYFRVWEGTLVVMPDPGLPKILFSG